MRVNIYSVTHLLPARRHGYHLAIGWEVSALPLATCNPAADQPVFLLFFLRNFAISNALVTNNALPGSVSRPREIPLEYGK